jgi:transposase
MQKLRFVGLDVHKDSIAVAVAEADGSAPELVATVPGDTKAVLKQLKKMGSSAQLRCCYEAGPTGLGLHRALTAAGISCVVVAPSLVPQKSGDRVKTDRRDAAKLARFLRSGDLTPIHVHDEASEAMRDLERARDDAKNAERVARQQLSKFLLRHGRSYPGKTAWTRAHVEWIRGQHFEQEAHNRVLPEYLRAVEEAGARVERFTKDIVELVESWHLKPVVKSLQALRGVRVLTAVILAAELGDMARFATAPQMMAFVGLVPSEHSSGGTQKRGRITRTGNRHVRRILTEAAWAYRSRPAVSQAIRKRCDEASPAVQAIAWKAQGRLHGRYKRMTARGKNKQQTVTAVARELVGFVWAIARQTQHELRAA